ncbi:MAG: sulfatase-like hydrolase/transferase [Verrucomicrobia bacterium]|nr:sulfatase-like hydrolase/transferase [Verrucomicrobiota bacterium]
MKLYKNLISCVCTVILVAFSLNGADRKPNVILIMSDDASWECFGSYGAEDYRTPNIDKLASKGIQFQHCYSTPICTTSRVKLMTGKYNFRNYTHFGYLNPREKTFGHLLQEAGYKTAIAGKWQLNGLYHGALGNQDRTRPLKAGFDESLLWQVTKGKSKKDGGGERFWSPPLEHNGVPVTSKTNHGKYGPDLLTDFVCDFIEKNQDEPFFVYYPMVLVHDPFLPTPDSIGHMSLEEAMIQPKDPRQLKANFVAMVNYMDKLVGRIAAKVEDLGLSDDTIILFTSDNGTNTKLKSGWNGIEIPGGKGGLTDMGTHVPFVAYWKGHTPKGRVSEDLVEFTDFYTTLADVAGVELGVNEPIDGQSFFPQLNGKRGHPRNWVLNHYQPYWGPKPGQYVRNAQYKLYRDGRFFEVPKDLFEKHNIADSANSEAQAVRNQLQSLLSVLPLVVEGKGNDIEKQRPVYPSVKNLFVEFD